MRNRQGDNNGALQLALSAKDVFQQHRASQYSIWCMQLIAEIYIYRMKYPDAVLTLRLALRDSQKVSGTDRTKLDVMVFLAFSLFYMADYDEAEPVARKAVIEGKGIFGAADSQTVKPQILLEKIKIAIRDIDLERIPRNRASIGHALNAKLPFMCQISNWRARLSPKTLLSSGTYRGR